MIRFSIRNPVVVNLLAASVLIVGAFSLAQLPREVFPEVKLNWVYVVTQWPGASPEEVERLITIPLEEEIASVDRIGTITSTSYEGRSVVSVKFEAVPTDEFRALLQDLTSNVDQVNDLPDGADDPTIINFTTEDFMPAIQVVISGADIPESRLQNIARELRLQIKRVQGVKGAQISGRREPEVWVEVDPSKLRSAGLSLGQISAALKSQNVGFPVGAVKTGAQEYTLRLVDQFTSPEDVGETIVSGNRSSGFLRVSDVATVKSHLRRRETSMRFNGEPALAMLITKTPGSSSLDVIEDVKELTRSFGESLPEGDAVTFHYVGDTSRQIEGILDILQKNAVVGLLLVIVTLYFFLGFRNALFAAFGIPITFMVTFIFLYASGGSFNSNSLFGLVLVLGVVVDDAIIVIENCYRYIQRGYSPVNAALEGAREVATPVLAATGTTIAGFLPLMLMPGIIGQFLKIVPIVVSLALIASLLEAFLVLPSHIAEWSSRKAGKKHRVTRREKVFARLNHIYVPLVSKSIRHRYWVVGFVVMLLGTAPVLVNHLGVEMFRDEEFPSIVVQVWMPAASNIDETERVLLEMEEKLAEVPQEDILGYSATAGFLMTQQDWFFKSSVAQIQLDLTDMDSRTISNDSLIAEMRLAFADVIGPVSIEYMKIESGPPVGAPLEVKVKGRYLGELEEASNELMAKVKNIDGMYDVRDNFEPGKREIRYKVDVEVAARLGFTVEQIAREMLIAFEGLEATSYRDGDEEIRVVVKFPEEMRSDVSALETMRLTGAMGQTVALSDLTTKVEARGVDEIRRFNQERAITISGEINKEVIQIDKVATRVAELYKDISKRHPGYRLDFGGEWNEFKNAFGSLSRLFVVGLLLIYMILGAQFKSFLQPFIILFTIPFAIIGAMTGLLYLGDPFSIATLYGIVALSGVVVNDALVLVDFVNRGRTKGSSRYLSLIRAGKRRLRPILSTSITTIFGLMPMAIGLGGRSIVWGPLATTIVWGLSIATILTLFVIPALYAITDDIKARFGMRLAYQPHDI